MSERDDVVRDPLCPNPGFMRLLAVRQFPARAEPSPATDNGVPYWELQQRDSVYAGELAEKIAHTHLALYKWGPFRDLAGLKNRHEAAWYVALGAFALRFCRISWRRYAHRQALERAERYVEEFMSQYFVGITREHRHELLKGLTHAVILAHQHALDGTATILPREYLELEAEEREAKR